MGKYEDRMKKAVKLKAAVELNAEINFKLKRLERKMNLLNYLKELRTIFTHDQLTSEPATSTDEEKVTILTRQGNE